MTISPFFNNYANVPEQTLVEDLIIESIKIHGMNVYYLPKTLVGFDKIYGEDSVMEFNSAIPIEMYIKNIDSFGGDGSFFSKFNIEIRDQLTLTVARRRFNQVIGTPNSIPRPNEGDLIYFPLNNKMFRIQYADEKAIFYQFGTLQTFDLTTEVYEYSNERFNTGIAVIDEIETRYSTGTAVSGIENDAGELITDSDGFPITSDDYNTAVDPFDDSNELQNEADTIRDFSEDNPFAEDI
jgi:hypothetical protein